MSSTGERVVAGRYRLRRQLGQGAMGTVWEAYDEFLHRPVAVKEVLLPPGMPDEQAAELRERTMREARAIAALSHPNVVMLHDVARESGEPFVVMEYHVAHSLATVINVLGPLPASVAAAIGNAVAAGLAAAHRAGITHRDVKPGNVLIGVDGQVKLTDFGIARNVSEQTLTSTGIMLGSPAYISPEVAAGREVTPSADLWGLGATLFAALEGRPPYDVDGAVLETVNQVVHGEVPRSSSAEGPLAEVLAGLMVKEPKERITLREVRNKLHPLLPPPSSPLLSEEDLRRLDEATSATTAIAVPQSDRAAEAPETEERSDAPLAADPGPLPPALAKALSADTDEDADTESEAEEHTDNGASGADSATDEAPSLAETPGPLPFGVTMREGVSRRRGAVGSVTVFVIAVIVFLIAAGTGFALSRYVGGKELLPPRQSNTTTTSQVPEKPGALKTRTGNAATVTGAQGGGYTVPVPGNWVSFTEEIPDKKFVNSTRVYYVSADGTQLLTVERLAGYYQSDHTIVEYVDRLKSTGPDLAVEIEYKNGTTGLGEGPVKLEPAQELKFRSTADAKELVPHDAAALNQNRVTIAWLLPYVSDLWVVSVTVPIEQEDSGAKLFEQIAPQFKVTG